MDHDRVVVRVEPADEPGEVTPLLVGVRVLLAQVPGERQVVPEAGDQLTVVETAQTPELAAIERLVVLGLLQHEVKLDADLVHVGEDDLPLLQLADVEAGPFAVAGPGPDIAPVSAVDVVGEEVDAVHPLAREVVEGADDALALTALPCRIAGLPVGDVRLVPVQEVAAGVVGTVELRVGEEVLGAVRPALEEALARRREHEVALPDVLQEPPAPEIGSRLVRGGHRERAGCAIERGRRSCARTRTNRHVLTGAERGHVRPVAHRVGDEAHAPLPSAGGAGFCGVAVGGVEPRHLGDPAAGSGERHLQAIVPERVRGRVLACVRAVEGERDGVPLPQLTRHGGSGRERRRLRGRRGYGGGRGGRGGRGSNRRSSREWRGGGGGSGGGGVRVR